MHITKEECQTVIDAALAIEENISSSGTATRAGIIADIMIDVKNDDHDGAPEAKNVIDASLQDAIEALKMQAVGCFAINESIAEPSKEHKEMISENEGFLRGFAARLDGIRAIFQEFNLVHVDANVMPVDCDDCLKEAILTINSAIHTLSIVRMMTDQRTDAALDKVHKLLDVAMLEIHDATKALSPPE